MGCNVGPTLFLKDRIVFMAFGGFLNGFMVSLKVTWVIIRIYRL